MAQSYTTLKTEQPHTSTRITHHYSYWILPISEHSFDHSPRFQGPSVIPDDQRGVHEVSHAHGHNMYAAIRGTLIGRGGQDTAIIVLPKTVRGGGKFWGDHHRRDKHLEHKTLLPLLLVLHSNPSHKMPITTDWGAWWYHSHEHSIAIGSSRYQ